MESKYIISVIVSLVAGTLYYYNMTSSIPKDSKCSFSANVWTNIGATMFGIIIIYYGISYDNTILISMGGMILTEHILQSYHTTLKK